MFTLGEENILTNVLLDFDSISGHGRVISDEVHTLSIFGYITNEKSLLQRNRKDNLLQVAVDLREKKIPLFTEMDGEYLVVLENKLTENVYISPNYYSSYPVYYGKGDVGWVVSNSIKKIYTHLKKKPAVDICGLKMIMGYGFCLGTKTILSGVKKLLPGCDVNFSFDNLTITRSSSFLRDEQMQSNCEIFDNLDMLFNNAVSSIFEYTESSHLNSIVTLSGGLDSRLTYLESRLSGHEVGQVVSFGEVGSLDVKIAVDIAKDFGDIVLINALDGGNYLKCIARAVSFNDGMALYSGAAHVLDTMIRLSVDDNCIVHTGQLGDAVLGSFAPHKKDSGHISDDSLYLGAYNRDYVKKNRAEFSSELSDYHTEEQFLFINRGFNGANNGLVSLGRLCKFSSPFMDRKFFEYCLTIPTDKIAKQKIYIEWINDRKPHMTKYEWEKWRLRPLNCYHGAANSMIFRYAKYQIFEVLLKQGMNPFEKWKRDNCELVKILELRLTQFHDKELLQEVIGSDLATFLKGATLIRLILATTVVAVCEYYA